MMKRLSESRLRKAIALVDWFKVEAMSVYAMFGETKKDIERRHLIDFIRRNGSRMTERQLQQKSRRYKTSREATLALDELVKTGEGYWKPIKAGKTGGRATRVFVLGE